MLCDAVPVDGAVEEKVSSEIGCLRIEACALLLRARGGRQGYALSKSGTRKHEREGICRLAKD